jgi:hypothetical protein
MSRVELTGLRSRCTSWLINEQGSRLDHTDGAWILRTVLYSLSPPRLCGKNLYAKVDYAEPFLIKCSLAHWCVDPDTHVCKQK